MEKDLARKTVKNSVYSVSAGIIAKLGSLALTILLARMLLPEMFGIYSLVLSIVLIVFTFTDLGINSAVYRYLSFALKNNNTKKARSYLRYLLKIKGILLLLAIILMFILAPILANHIYNKPIILLPLLFATIYIFVNAFRSFFEGIYFPTKDLSKYPLTTSILHGLRFVLALVALILISRESAVTAIFITFALASLLTLVAVFIALGKRRNLIFGKTQKIKTPPVNKYIGFMSIASVGLIFFGSIDTLMLGYFVDAEFIGYYRAALGMVVSLVAIFSLSNIFLPIFTQSSKKRMNQIFQKAFRYISLLSIPAALGIIVLGRHLIKAFYGNEYALAIMPLYALSFLMVIYPLLKLYSSLFESKEQTKTIANITIVSLIVNIALNYIVITSLLGFGQDITILGVGFATLASKAFYLSLLAIKAKPRFNISIQLSSIAKPIIAGLVMVLILVAYNLFVEINIITGILEILLGILIYFFVMWLIKGVDKKDLDLAMKFFPNN